jgi:hypothetical protein
VGDPDLPERQLVTAGRPIVNINIVKPFLPSMEEIAPELFESGEDGEE